MRTASLAAALLTLSLSSPAAAGQVYLRFFKEIVNPYALALTETGEEVPDGSVVASLDPNPLIPEVIQIGPGRARQELTSTGTLTNSLDEPVSGVFDIDGGIILDGRFETQSERVSIFASFLAVVGEQRIGTVRFDGRPLGPTVFECDEIPCRYVEWLPDGWEEEFTIGAGETRSIEFSVEVAVEVIAPIPLPAAFGPLALALGGLAWAGRRAGQSRPAP